MALPIRTNTDKLFTVPDENLDHSTPWLAHMERGNLAYSHG